MTTLGDREAEALRKWGIDIIEKNPGVNHRVEQFIDNWLKGLREGAVENVLVAEKDLTPGQPELLVSWILTRAMGQNPKPLYIHRMTGLSVIGFSRDEEAILELKQRLSSAPIVWIAELSAAELSNAERNKLLQFLTDMDRQGKTVIITASLSVDQVFEWVGPVVNRFFERHFRIVVV